MIRQMRANSLFRALRVDKLTYAALEATLLGYAKGDYEAIPAARMMRLSREEIGRRAKALIAGDRDVPGLRAEMIEGESVIGGGAAPSAVLPTWLVAVAVEGLSADETVARLRRADVPVIARVQDDRVVLDLRTVFPEQDELVASVLRFVAGAGV